MAQPLRKDISFDIENDSHEAVRVAVQMVNREVGHDQELVSYLNMYNAIDEFFDVTYNPRRDAELHRGAEDAVMRLFGSGQDKTTILQVYLACDKDEAAAANCLAPMT
jgi:hypothetical protein